MLREAASGCEKRVHGIGKCLGILQKFIRGSLEEGKILLIVIELWISGLLGHADLGGHHVRCPHDSFSDSLHDSETIREV